MISPQIVKLRFKRFEGRCPTIDLERQSDRI
jgi:hypothetical protein